MKFNSAIAWGIFFLGRRYFFKPEKKIDSDWCGLWPAQADIIDENAYREFLSVHPLTFAGSGSDKCRPLLRSPNAFFLENIHPTAQAMIPLATAAYLRQDFADPAYFDPFYLKEFQATVPRDRGLGRG